MNIKKDNKKYPLKEYFLDRKPLEDCSPECQEQVADLGKENPPKEPILTINGFGSAGDRIKKNILDRLEKDGFNRDRCDSTIEVVVIS